MTHSDLSQRFNYLLNCLRDKKHDTFTQREILGVLVRTIEHDYHWMDNFVKTEATELILDLQSSLKEHKCQEIEENCRMGLGEFNDASPSCNLLEYILALLGYVDPLKTDYLRVLSIDGGGIRGIVVIELMKRLEEMTGKRFFELFDFICGVSTGSIFVCGLVAKNRTLMEGKALYKEVARRVFHMPSTFDLFASTSRLITTHAYYDVDLWEKLLQQYMTDTRIIDTAKFTHVRFRHICLT